MFSSLYPKIFISIVVGLEKMSIYCEIFSKNKLKKSFLKVFETSYLDNQVEAYIQECIKESPIYYIALLDNSTMQGALNSCDDATIRDMCDINKITYKCYDTWAYYTSRYDLELHQNEYKNIGLDLIYSPFVILANFFVDKIDLGIAMYALVEETFLTLAIFKNSKLLYSEHINMDYQKNKSTPNTKTQDDSQNLLEGIDLDSINLDSADSSFSNLVEIEEITFDDNGSLDEFDSFDDSTTHLDIQKVEEVLDHNYERFLFIQKALNSFYKDDSIESDFIETIYIADALEIDSNFRNYIKDELFLNVIIRSIDLPKEITKLAKVEIDAI